jgi:phospholipase D1/2
MREQEGARGRGPGRHEREIPDGDDGNRHVVDSPTEEGPGDGDKDEPPKAGSTNIRHDEPLDTTESGRCYQQSNIDQGEKFEGRGSERNRKLTDEIGRMPDGLPGVKEEEAPGPRNEIVLAPRISHLQVGPILRTWRVGRTRVLLTVSVPSGDQEHREGSRTRSGP